MSIHVVTHPQKSTGKSFTAFALPPNAPRGEQSAGTSRSVKKKLMFLIWALDVGGSERLLVKLVQQIPKDRYDITVVCLFWKGVWADELETKGIKVVSMGKRKGFDPWILPRLISLMRREKPDLVNTHLWTADLWGRLSAVLAGVKHIVVTEQNVDVWKRWYNKIIDRVLFRWTDYVICVSDGVVGFYHKELGVPHRKMRMIPNAIDITPFDRPECADFRLVLGRGGEYIFTCAARLHAQKAHEVLFESVELLCLKGVTGFRVNLVGDGERRRELEGLVRAKKLEDRIAFLGLRQDIPAILSQSDAFVLSSDYEGMPLAILEAMAARLPVVATAVGGVPQLVMDGETGYLVPPRQPQALADAMAALLRDKECGRKMGLAGRKIIEERYLISAITEQTLALFEQCFSA